MEQKLDASRIPFKPVRGLEENIQNMSTVDGYLYFATDSRKTYLGTAEGEKLLMGNDIGVFYGKKDIPKNDSGGQQDPVVYFNLTKDIEGTRLPQVNDLILNSDGCFYRVENVISAVDVKTKRLTLQGTGGGGGTGPSGPDVGYSWSMWFPSQNVAYSTEAEKMELSFETALTGSTDNHIIQAALYWGEYLNLDEEIPFFTTDVNSKGGIMELDTVETIDITSQKSLFAETNKTVTLALTDKYGVRHSASVKIRLVKLELIMATNKLVAVPNSSFEFSCDLDGVSSGVTEKQIVYTFYKSGEDRAALTITNTLKQPNYTGVVDYVLDVSSLEHGSYKMTVQAFAKVTGMGSAIPSNILTH